MTKKKRLFALVIAAFILGGALVLVAKGAGKDAVTAESVGYFDLNQMAERFPDFAKLKEIKAASEEELTQYAAAQRQSYAAYYQELEEKKDKEIEGKTEAQMQEIEHSYEQMAQAKAIEIKQNIEAKKRELQAKMDEEAAKAGERLRQTVGTVGAQKGCNLVLIKTALYQGGLDLTEDVVKEANKGKPK